MNNTLHTTDTCYYPIEIAIPGAGAVVNIEKALPLLYDMAEGVTVLNPGGNHGKGTLELAVAGEEIFPENFHTRAYMLIQSSHHDDAMITRKFDRYIYEFSERAKGSTVSARYTEPPDGESGVLYLIFKLSKHTPC